MDSTTQQSGQHHKAPSYRYWNNKEGGNEKKGEQKTIKEEEKLALPAPANGVLRCSLLSAVRCLLPAVCCVLSLVCCLFHRLVSHLSCILFTLFVQLPQTWKFPFPSIIVDSHFTLLYRNTLPITCITRRYRHDQPARKSLQSLRRHPVTTLKACFG
jgi:hypothetical protein